MFIKACFKKYAKNHNNSFMVFSFNIIYYRYNKSIYYYLITINIKFHLERIYAINKNYINTINLSRIVKFAINSLYSLSRFKINQLNYSISFQFIIIKLFLSKNEYYHIT